MVGWLTGCGEPVETGQDGGTEVVTGQDGGGQESGTPPAPVTALPATTFLYVHYPKGDEVGHIYAYDIATKQSRLITELDNTTKTPRVAISPDRKWFALVAFFRPNDTDLKQGIPIPSIWVVSVDGKQFRRVTEPLLNTNASGASCSADAQCPATGFCNTTLGKCSLRNYSMYLGVPSWSADGKTIWTTLSQFWNEGTRLTGGGVPASVAASGGVLEPHVVNSGCAQVTHVAAHPKASQLAAIHSVCSSGKPGLHSYAVPPKEGTQMFFDASVEVSLGKLAWLPDGSGILFLANTGWDLNGDQKPDVNGIGVAGYDIGKKQLSAIIPPLKTGLSLTGMTLSPDGKKLVVCVFDSSNSTNSLYMLDSDDQQNPFKPIVEDGKSCEPAW
jgi:Tol biopolymer transport system component